MALVKIYDLDGVEFEKESVDARECVLGGSFTYEKESKSKIKEKIKDKFKEEIIAEKEQQAKAAELEKIKAEALAEVSVKPAKAAQA